MSTDFPFQQTTFIIFVDHSFDANIAAIPSGDYCYVTTRCTDAYYALL